MLRDSLNDAMKEAMRQKDKRALSTIRLVLAAIKDRDISARPSGNANGITDEDILSLLQSMIKQRRETITLYEQGGRMELAEQEGEEIQVIERFLPTQMTEAEVAKAFEAVVTDLGATSLKDMGRVMAALKDQYAGQMDFTKVAAMAKARLS